MTDSGRSDRPAAAVFAVLPSIRQGDDNSATATPWNADVTEVNNLSMPSSAINDKRVMPTVLLTNIDRIINKLYELYVMVSKMNPGLVQLLLQNLG